MTKVSTGKLQKNYSSLDEFLAYANIYNLHGRLGYKNPRTAWKKNPMIQWSTNPNDFKKVKQKKKVNV